MSNRKTRQSAKGKSKPGLTKLKELPSADRAKLMEILRAHTIKDSAPLVEKVFGFAYSEEQLSRFYRWQVVQEDLEQANDTMAQVEEFIARQNKDWTPEKVRNAAITFFTAQTTSNKDLEGFVSVTKLVLDREKGEREDRKLTLERERFEIESAEKMLSEALRRRAEEIANSNLSNGDKIAAMRKVAFKSVDELEASGKVQIPKA